MVAFIYLLIHLFIYLSIYLFICLLLLVHAQPNAKKNENCFGFSKIATIFSCDCIDRLSFML